jgi:hypothetical protein
LAREHTFEKNRSDSKLNSGAVYARFLPFHHRAGALQSKNSRSPECNDSVRCCIPSEHHRGENPPEIVCKRKIGAEMRFWNEAATNSASLPDERTESARFLGRGKRILRNDRTFSASNVGKTTAQITPFAKSLKMRLRLFFVLEC